MIVYVTAILMDTCSVANNPSQHDDKRILAGIFPYKQTNENNTAALALTYLQHCREHHKQRSLALSPSSLCPTGPACSLLNRNQNQESRNWVWGHLQCPFLNTKGTEPWRLRRRKRDAEGVEGVAKIIIIIIIIIHAFLYRRKVVTSEAVELAPFDRAHTRSYFSVS